MAQSRSASVLARWQTLHKLYIGVDYGTTSTGVGYAVSTEKIEDIHIIQKWPGTARTGDNQWKTPSRIAYPSENPSLTSNAWGFGVTPKLKSYSWTKLLLDDGSVTSGGDTFSLEDMKETEGNGLLKLPDGKSVSDVVADFLVEVRKHVITHLEQTLGGSEILRITPKELWFTVPAVWSDKAKDATKRAALTAFGDLVDERIYFVAEPEAAAVATLTQLTSEGALIRLKPGDGVLICDCGGGTVDLTPYVLVSTSPCLEFEELAVGDGGKCGSTYIDREFHSWMSKTFGEPFDKKRFEDKGPGSRFMKEFEMWKHDFGHERLLEMEISLKMEGVGESAYYDGEENSVLLGQEHMEGFFRPIVETIISLVRKQVNSVPNDKIKQVILVGGLGDSRYLNVKLGDWCRRHGLNLSCPEHPQAAVVKGAVIRALEGIKPNSRRARYHYGHDICRPFRKGIDSEAHAFICPWDGEKMCKNRVNWVINKGQTLTEHTVGEFVMTWTSKVDWIRRTGAFSPTLDLHASQADPAAEHITNMIFKVGRVEATVPINLAEYPERRWHDGKEFIRIQGTIMVIPAPENGTLSFKMTIENKEAGTATIRYVD